MLNSTNSLEHTLQTDYTENVCKVTERLQTGG